MSADPEFCVCVLAYGNDDHCFKLAQRVFNAAMLRLGQHSVEFRIGLNAVGDKTARFVREEVCPAISTYFNPVIIEEPTNVFKYPMMRKLFHARSMRAPITMWFDDDSCIVPDTDAGEWLRRIQQQLDSFKMIGSVYKQRLTSSQQQWITDQWWYNNKPPQPYVNFATGGWWAIKTQELLRFDWPLPELKHRGGDVMLGELCRQHDLAIGHFRDKVWINANDQGVESKSPRRGYDEPPIGANYKRENNDVNTPA